MVEADCDAHGYDHAGEKACVWAFLRLSLSIGATRARASGAKTSTLNGFGFRVWRSDEVA